MTEATNIITKLVAAKEAIGFVAKAERNTQQNFNFRGIDAVVNAVAPVFASLGIMVFPSQSESRSVLVTYGAKSTVGFRTEVKVTYTFTDGESSIQVEVVGEAIDSGDKGTAKAMSVAFRIALLQALTLPTAEPDPDSESFQVTDGEATRNATLEAAFIALKESGMTSEQRRALIEQAIGHEMEGKFGDLSLDDASKVLWAVEDSRTVAAIKAGNEEPAS